MSPEQSTTTDHLTPASDIYALGLILFEMLTGRTYRNVRPGTRARDLRTDVPRWLDNILVQMLAEDPNERPWDGAEALKKLQEGGQAVPPEKDRRLPFDVPAWAYAIGGMLSLATIAIVFYIIIPPGPGGSTETTHTPTPEANSKTPIIETIPVVAKTPTDEIFTLTQVEVYTSTPTQGSIATNTPAPPPPTATPAATPLGGGGLIAFQSNRAGGEDIYVMNYDGSNIVQLTFDKANETVPSWSPDGHKLAFQSNKGGDWEIFVLTLTTGQTHQVTNNHCDDFAPAWSPDGKRFVYYSNCGGNTDSREIFIINTDGSNRRQITDMDGVWNWFPTWSPDGSLITFSSSRSAGNVSNSDIDGRYYIYTMKDNGTILSSLAKGCISSFSPDGEHIVFGHYCDDTGEIFLMRADGSKIWTLDKKYENKNPSWSRDGQRIVFQSEESKGNMDIWSMDLEGEDWIRLTNSSTYDAVPVWQP